MSMEISARTQRRLMKDISNMQKDTSLKENGIYFYVNPDYICDIKAMMIGPKDTPYEGGFFFFQINVDPIRYPMVPPKVKYLTTDGKVRFNPNLYENGKVCLSMIGTWSGPGWAPCNTITSLLMAIQGLVLVDWPLKNEPGHESDSEKNLAIYNNIIEHETMRYAVTMMLERPPLGFGIFKDTMEQYVYDNVSRYRELMTARMGHNGKKYNSPVYSMYITCNYTYLLKKFNKLFETVIYPTRLALLSSTGVKVDDTVSETVLASQKAAMISTETLSEEDRLAIEAAMLDDDLVYETTLEPVGAPAPVAVATTTSTAAAEATTE
jgi:ubiquitin-conjugating enzyme E2 Z